ncbi:SGNH/GDSL hydrolase family protein [Granulicella sp. 5B5]|uniref:SGNH/GDSL hydrolase family protein n=1 Tax=Granulicella sp. 5B5 TaxID=1617967 RepID=UPI0015F444D5|nr:SGNH/GDSL hydrolase family protein [Granulicella sp. 5B5]
MKLSSASKALIAVTLTTMFCGVTPLHSQTASASIIDEPIEWTWAVRPEHPDPALPNVLLIGDSITRGYYPDVVKDLQGKANCYLYATSAAAGDPRLPGQLNDLFALYKVPFSVIHFNNGMHGWGYTETQYAGGLKTMLAAIRHHAPAARLLWASTTPVTEDSKGVGATNPRIDQRNALALSLMQQNKITVDDQHALMLQHQGLHNGTVHYKPEGYEVQAAQAAASITALLPAPKQ